MMEEVIKELQSITDLPLQIDTADIEAMERGMRIYNGKPLINSVNGKEEVMEAVFPLVKKYGGTVVALCLDENGIPDTAEGRIRIARKIYEKAEQYGIGAKDILIDGLCMTVSSDSKGALTTLETLRRIRDELGGKSILGVSNISFGLPQRENINAAFFTMAMQSGLKCSHYQSQFRGYDEGVLLLPGAVGVGFPVRRLYQYLQWTEHRTGRDFKEKKRVRRWGQGMTAACLMLF